MVAYETAAVPLMYPFYYFTWCGNSRSGVWSRMKQLPYLSCLHFIISLGAATVGPAYETAAVPLMYPFYYFTWCGNSRSGVWSRMKQLPYLSCIHFIISLGAATVGPAYETAAVPLMYPFYYFTWCGNSRSGV